MIFLRECGASFLLIANLSDQSVSLFENLSNNSLSLEFPCVQNTENNVFLIVFFFLLVLKGQKLTNPSLDLGVAI